MAEPGTALADLASALTAAATRIDDVLTLGVEAVFTLVGDGAAIQVVQADGYMHTAAARDNTPAGQALLDRIVSGEVRPSTDRFDEGLSGVMWRSRQPVVQQLDRPSQLHGAGDATQARFAELGIHAILAAPMFSDDRYLGYVLAGRHTPDHGYSSADVSLLTDIAARITLALVTAQAVEQLRASEEQYRLIVETTNEGILLLDTDGTIRFVNERFGDMIGTNRDRLIGTNLRNYLRPSEADTITPRMKDRQAGESESYEAPLIRADGSLLWVHVNAAPASGPDGVITGSLCMITDISDSIRSRELAEHVTRLQRLDDLGTLAGGAAHDLNNLLAIIASLATELHETTTGDGTTSRLTQQISQAARKGAHLTNQLLAVSRGETTDVRDVNVVDMINSLEPLLQHTVGRRIALSLVLHPATTPVRLAAGQLEQILLNLATNARDAITGNGEVRISATNTNSTPPGSLTPGPHVRIAVADTGHGMDEATLQRATELFFTTKPADKGTGLGLAGVQAILRSAGGWLDLHSQPAGTTVTVYLPALPN